MAVVLDIASRVMRDVTEEQAARDGVGVVAVHMVNTEPWEFDDIGPNRGASGDRR